MKRKAEQLTTTCTLLNAALSYRLFLLYELNKTAHKADEWFFPHSNSKGQQQLCAIVCKQGNEQCNFTKLDHLNHEQTTDKKSPAFNWTELFAVLIFFLKAEATLSRLVRCMCVLFSSRHTQRKPSISNHVANGFLVRREHNLHPQHCASTWTKLQQRYLQPPSS